MLMSSLKRAVALGSKYGLSGIPMFADSTVDTPEIDEAAMEGAVGVVITIASVIITLYLTAIITGMVSKQIYVVNATNASNASSGMGLSAGWNTTIVGMDTQANSSFTLAGILPIAIVGVGILVIIISAFATR